MGIMKIAGAEGLEGKAREKLDEGNSLPLLTIDLPWGTVVAF